MTAGADQTFREVVRDAIGRGDTIREWIEKCGGRDQALAALSLALGVDPAIRWLKSKADRTGSDLAGVGMAGRR